MTSERSPPFFSNALRQASIRFRDRHKIGLNDEKKTEETIPSNVFSKYHTMTEQLCTESKIKECKAIQRIQGVLQFYTKSVNKIENNEIIKNENDPNKLQFIVNNIDLIQDIQMEFGDEYKIQNILNDHVHIVLKHTHFLEQIYNLISIKCNLSKCNGIKRLHRDRTRQNVEIKNAEQNAQNMVILDILDQTHCYLLHTFDIGFKLTEEEKASIKSTTIQTNTQQELKNNDDDNEDIADDNQTVKVNTSNSNYNEINKILKAKRYTYRYSIDGSHRIEHSKFVTKMVDNKQSENENDKNNDNDKKNDDDEKKLKVNEEENVNLYSFSHRWYYWKKYKNNNRLDFSNPGYKYCMMYVKNKYKNFKDEILNNEICNISNEQWNSFYFKASSYREIPFCQRIKCIKYRFPEYKIDTTEIITIYHLMSIILYTDLTELSYQFTLSFREKTRDESLFELRARHSNFYWWARSMREAVECFGSEVNKSCTKTFWHGISIPMVFKSTIARFNAPTSTTTQIEVASNFATNGIILQLTAFYKTGGGGYFFNCQWLSCYSNESERLFIGGYWPLKFENIINCIDGMHYKVYLHAFGILVASFNGLPLSTDHTKVNKMDRYIIRNLLKYTNKCKKFDPYFMSIYDSFRQNKRFFNFDLFYLTKKTNYNPRSLNPAFSGYPFLGKLLMTNPSDPMQSFIKIGLISKFFPNVVKLCVYYHGGYHQPLFVTNEYLQIVFDILSVDRIHSVKLKNIKIDKSLISNKFKKKFKDIGYETILEGDDNIDLSLEILTQNISPLTVLAPLTEKK